MSADLLDISTFSIVRTTPIQRSLSLCVRRAGRSRPHESLYLITDIFKIGFHLAPGLSGLGIAAGPRFIHDVPLNLYLVNVPLVPKANLAGERAYIAFPVLWSCFIPVGHLLLFSKMG